MPRTAGGRGEGELRAPGGAQPGGLLGAGVGYTEVRDEFDPVIDLGVSFLHGGGFLGAGLGLWGIGDDSLGTNLLFNAGWNLGESPVALYLEGRVFSTSRTAGAPNYLLFAGLRLRP